MSFFYTPFISVLWIRFILIQIRIQALRRIWIWIRSDILYINSRENEIIKRKICHVNNIFMDNIDFFIGWFWLVFCATRINIF